MVLEITLLESSGAALEALERTEISKDQIARLTSEGKTRVIATVQVRTKIGEGFSARIGQRVPVQTSTLPVFRNADMDKRDSVQGVSVGIPQIAYENTGLLVDGASTAVLDGQVDIKLKIEMTGVDVSTGNLTPTFTSRTFNNQVRMKESDTALLLTFLQDAPLSVPSQRGTVSSAADSSRRTFIVLLSTKPVL